METCMLTVWLFARQNVQIEVPGTDCTHAAIEWYDKALGWARRSGIRLDDCGYLYEYNRGRPHR